MLCLQTFRPSRKRTLHFIMNRAARLDPDTLFSDIARSPAEHFRIYFFDAVLGLIEHVSARFRSFDEAMKRFPFLATTATNRQGAWTASPRRKRLRGGSHPSMHGSDRRESICRCGRCGEALELDHAAMMWVLTQAGFPMPIA